MPEPGPRNTPAALITLAPAPAAPPPIGKWIRLLGAHGATVYVARREDPDGFTLFGDRLLAVADLDDLDSQMDEADRDDAVHASRFPAAPAGMPEPDGRATRYHLVDEATGAAVRPRVVGSSLGRGFSPTGVDGDQLRWLAVRARRLR